MLLYTRYNKLLWSDKSEKKLRKLKNKLLSEKFEGINSQIIKNKKPC